MTCNRQLALERGLSEESILEIDRIHSYLGALINTWIECPYSEELEEEIHELEFKLQALWGFPQDDRYHRWASEYNFMCQWYGRSFKCAKTGETITLGKDIYPKQFISFGKCAIDLGVPYGYSRKIGEMIEITGGTDDNKG